MMQEIGQDIGQGEEVGQARLLSGAYSFCKARCSAVRDVGQWAVTIFDQESNIRFIKLANECSTDAAEFSKYDKCTAGGTGDEYRWAVWG